MRQLGPVGSGDLRDGDLWRDVAVGEGELLLVVVRVFVGLLVVNLHRDLPLADGDLARLLVHRDLGRKEQLLTHDDDGEVPPAEEENNSQV